MYLMNFTSEDTSQATEIQIKPAKKIDITHKKNNSWETIFPIHDSSINFHSGASAREARQRSTMGK